MNLTDFLGKNKAFTADERKSLHAEVKKFRDKGMKQKDAERAAAQGFLDEAQGERKTVIDAVHAALKR